MQNFSDKKVAIVCDWVKDWGGAEGVLEQFMDIFPQADIFTSVFFTEKKEAFEWRKITTSFIQKIPFLWKSHKLALNFRPLAFESFDLSEYDIVISSTSAESKWVITKPNCLHICYCHTPTRYFWSHYHEYLDMMEFWFLNPLWKWLMPKIVHKLRQWDFCAAQRPDYFIANSKNTAKRIEKYYGRESEVIYPSIDTTYFTLSEKKQEYYFYIGRCIPYKKFDLLVNAFNVNGKKLILATNTDNKLYRDLKKNSKENIEWKLNISSEEKVELYKNAKAFLFPPEEDFWIVPLEAMACGTPVIAYWKWWALETVIDKKTGIFFDEQSIESLNAVLDTFENTTFNYKEIHEHTLSFDHLQFQKNILDFVSQKNAD